MADPIVQQMLEEQQATADTAGGLADAGAAPTEAQPVAVPFRMPGPTSGTPQTQQQGDVDPIVAQMKGEQDQVDQSQAQLLDFQAKNDVTDAGTRADVLRYSAASGLPPAFVEQNLDEVRKRVDDGGVDWHLVQYQHPELAQWMLDNPAAMPLVKDDVANLGTLHWAMVAPYYALWGGIQEQRLIAKQFAEANGTGSAERRAEIAALEAEYGNRDYGANNFLSKGYIGAYKMLPYLAGDLAARAVGGYAGAALGAPAGTTAAGAGGAAATAPVGGEGVVAAAPGAAVGGTAGAAVGQFVASGVYNYYENLGPMYWRLSQLKDANGRPLDPDTARAFAQGGAALTGGLMSGFMGKFAAKLPGVSQLLGDASANAVENALADETVASVVRKGGIEFGKTWLTGATMMAGQSALGAATEESAKAFSDQPFDVQWGNVRNALNDGYKAGLEDMWLISAIGPGREMLRDIGRARSSAEGAAQLETLLTSANSSKLLERSPETFRKAVEAMKTKDGAIENVYVPAEDWVSYWQKQKLDPARVAAEVVGDDGKSLADAIAAKGDLAIPVEKYLTKLAKNDHGQALLMDAKVNPEDLTPRQHVAEQKATDERLKQADKARKPELDAGAKEVFNFIRDQAVAAGIDKEDANANAKLVSETSRALAVRLDTSVRDAAWRAGLGSLRVLGPKGEAVAAAARERFQRFLGPVASSQLERRLASISDEQAAREHYLDPVTGARDAKAFDQLYEKAQGGALPEGKAVAVVTLPAAKGINDHPTAGGHDVTNDLLREVARPLVESNPETARGGTNFRFLVDKGQEQEQLDAAIAKVKGALKNPSIDVIGATGADSAKAFEALKADTERRRALPPEQPEHVPAKGALRPGLDVAGLKFTKELAKGEVPQELIAKVADRTERQHFEAAYLDQIHRDVEGDREPVNTGLLSAEGFRLTPPRAHTLSVDLRGLGSMSRDLGDQVLIRFARAMSELGGHTLDAAHLSGDEFAAKHDDAAVLERFAERLRSHLADVKVRVTHGDGKVELAAVDFRHGVGTDYAEADRDLNRKRRAEADRGLAGANRGVEPQAGGEGGAPREGEGDLAFGRSPSPWRSSLGQAFPVGEVALSQEALSASEDAALAHGVEQARAFIDKMRAPQRKAQAQSWLDYCLGDREKRPSVPDALKQEMADSFGVVDPAGHSFNEAGRNLEKPVGGRKVFNEQPYELRKYRLERLGYYPRVTQLPLAHVEGATVTLKQLPSVKQSREGLAIDAILRDLLREKGVELKPDHEVVTRTVRGPSGTVYQDTNRVFSIGNEQLAAVQHWISVTNATSFDATQMGAPTPSMVEDWHRNFVDQQRAHGDFTHRLIENTEHSYRQAGGAKEISRVLTALWNNLDANTDRHEMYGGTEPESWGHDLALELDNEEATAGSSSVMSDKYKVPRPGWVDERKHRSTELNVTRFFQPPDGGAAAPRGVLQMQVSPEGRPVDFNIRMLSGDRSTFAHEMSHFLSWSLHSIADSDLATGAIRADYDALLKWAGYDSAAQREQLNAERAALLKGGEPTGDAAKRLRAIDAKEERISHGFEQYLAEGVAPNKKLASVFSRFKDWMLAIYKGIGGIEDQYARNYGQPLALSDEVRGIFDRLLAGDRALDEARQAIGADVRIPGLAENMTPAERERMVQLRADSKLEGETETQRTAAQLLGQQVAEARARFRREAALELDQQPVYRAWRFFQGGTMFDNEGNPIANELLVDKKGQPLKVDRAGFVKQFGPDVARLMPTGMLSRSGGGAVDELAPLLGFGDGEQLVKALREATPLQREIDQRTQARVDTEFSPAQRHLADFALKAAQNDFAAEMKLLELRAMAKVVNPAAERRVRTVSLERLKRTADERVRDTAVGMLDPKSYANSERANSLKAAELWGAGKHGDAFERREAALFNQVLYRAAVRAQDELARAHDKLAATNDIARANQGKADPAYRDVHDALIAAVGIDHEAPATANLDGMLQRAENDGHQVDFDVDAVRELLNSPRDWDSLTVDEARNVADAIENIRHIASETNEVTLNGKRVARDSLLLDLANRAAEVRRKLAPVAEDKAAQTLVEKAVALRRSGSSVLQDVETWAYKLDGGHEGPAHDVFVKSRRQSRDVEVELTKGVLEKIRDAWRKVPKEIAKLRNQAEDLGDLLPPSDPAFAPLYTRSFLWMLFLNQGNEGNRQRIRDGNGWTDENVSKALSRLSPQECDFLQGVLDTMQSLYPAVAEAHERRTGLPLGRVEATPIVVGGREYAGGYFPLKYDSRKSAQGQRQAINEIKDLFPSNRAPATQRSHTKARVDSVPAPVDLSWNVVPAHLANVIHDLAYGDWVRQVANIVMRPRVPSSTAPSFDETVRTYLGPRIAGEIKPWLQDVAAASADSTAGHTNDFLRLLGSAATSRVALNAQGLNFASLARHSFDPWTSVVDSGIHPTRLVAAYAKQWNPLTWSDPAFALSKALAYHDAAYSENLRLELGVIGTKGGELSRNITRVAFAAHEFVHKFTAHVVFKAAFEQFKAEGDNDIEAADRADAVVDRNFPNGDIAEKPPILRTKYGAAAAVMFYGYASKVHNIRARTLDDAARELFPPPGVETKPVEAIAKVAGKWLALGAVSAIGSYLAGRAFKRDEDPLPWAAEEVVLSPLDDVAVVGPAAKKLLTGHKVSIASVPAIEVLENGMNKLGDAVHKAKSGKKVDESRALRIAESFVEAMGPTVGPAKSFSYAQALATKRAKPRNPFDVGAGLIYGQGKKPEKDSANPLSDIADVVAGKRRR